MTRTPADEGITAARRDAREIEANLKAEMTVSKVAETCKKIATQLQLGDGSYRWGSLYYDYGALEFACFANDASRAIVYGHFRRLLDAHGWTELRVTAHPGKNSVTVTFHKSPIIDTANDRRMPYGLH